jgi:hypothetical protein
MISSLIELTIFLAHDQVSFHVQTIGLNRGDLTAFCVKQGKRMLRNWACTMVIRGYALKIRRITAPLTGNFRWAAIFTELCLLPAIRMKVNVCKAASGKHASLVMIRQEN